MNNETITITTIIGWILVAAGLLLNHFKNRAKIISEVSASERRLEARITSLETKMEIFWKGVSFDAATILHKPHRNFQRRDELLDKYKEGILNDVECDELCLMLKAIINNGNPAEKQSASMLLNVLESKHNIVREVQRILKN
jgi:hypothetical protein